MHRIEAYQTDCRTLYDPVIARAGLEALPCCNVFRLKKSQTGLPLQAPLRQLSAEEVCGVNFRRRSGFAEKISENSAMAHVTTGR